MRKWILMIAGALILFGGLARKALAADPVIEMLMEKGIITEKEADDLYAEKAKNEPVLLKTAGGKLLLDGRAFAGFYQTGKDWPGSLSGRNTSAGSFEIPDAKIRFTWNPTDRIQIVNRLSLSNATSANTLDYLYLQYSGIIPADRKSRLRLGRIKVDFGEETWTNNPIEDNVGLISTSVANANVYDEGIELYGNFIPDKFGYSLSVTNGNGGAGGSDTTSSKAIAAKVFGKPVEPLYLSASYYTSGSLDANAADMSIFGITAKPAGATDWTRNIWEVDAKYQIKNLKLAGFYGQLTDDAKQPAGTADRNADYYAVEAQYSFTPKFYVAARYSVAKFDNGYQDQINSIQVNGAAVKTNKQERSSIGVGYNLSKNVICKAEYTWNQEGTMAAGQSKPDNDQWAIGVAAAF